LKTQDAIIAGIDLAATPLNSTGWATLKNRVISASHLFSDEEIMDKVLNSNPTLVAVDAPLSLPKERRFTRKADREMHKRGYPVLPPRFKTMEELTTRAIKLTQKIKCKGFDIIEVHPTSTRKALKMSTKDWSKIQKTLIKIGFQGDTKTRTLTPHEIDAATAALTGYLHLEQKTQLIGDAIEGFIVVPTQNDWRLIKL